MASKGGMSPTATVRLVTRAGVECWEPLAGRLHGRRPSAHDRWRVEPGAAVCLRCLSGRLGSPIQGQHCPPQLEEGSIKGDLKIACSPLNLWWVTALTRVVPYSGRTMKYKTLKIASWNVRTLLDSNPDLPKRRTALVAAELARYKIDIAAFSETRLPDSGSLTETGEGYTFFWQGAPLDQPRQMGVDIAVRSSILQTIPTAPTGISPRIMTWRIPLAKAQYATLLSVYGPTLPSEEHIKDTFYNCLHETLQNIPPRDMILLLGDLNARVGSSHHLWEGVLGQHGIGKCNENGLRLLTLCSEHSLTITNTKFQLRNMHKATWMHPRSGHWHLLDYVIVRQRDISEVLITRVMRGAEASTDHRLVRSILRLKIRPITRRRNLSPKINLAAFQNSYTREAFQQAVTDSLPSARQATGDSNITTESLITSWNNVCATLLQTAKAVLGSTNRRHRDWFDENAENIHDLITAKNKAHDLYLRNPSPTTRNQFSAVRSELQRLLRDMENKWWTNLAAQMQSYMDLGDLHNFYSSLKTAYGPAYSALTPVRSADGTHLLTDSTQMLDRWASHFRLKVALKLLDSSHYSQ
ncbi:uncharacterized protein LOC143022192 [Oratosquilla oratoria]|uniref:uncharacterized protein LOC143022192 n=1 Tax=Oratosquilla oratoria TaxID=337810 RepID=UPI003F761315